MSSIAFFDFDGTITNEDSLIKFIRFAVGNTNFLLGMSILAPMLLLYKLKFIPNYKAKQYMLSYFFKGWSEEKFTELTREYSLNHLNKIIRPKAIEKMNWHKLQGHKVVIVSASLELWLKPWCDENDLELIATKMEVTEEFLTGKFFGKNCYGIEKVSRIKKDHTLSIYTDIYAYGDSRGDKELLELANKSFYKPFRD